MLFCLPVLVSVISMLGALQCSFELCTSNVCSLNKQDYLVYIVTCMQMFSAVPIYVYLKYVDILFKTKCTIAIQCDFRPSLVLNRKFVYESYFESYIIIAVVPGTITVCM